MTAGNTVRCYVAVLALAGAGAAQAASVVQCGAVYDATMDAPRSSRSILVEDGRIATVATEVQAPPDAQRIDLGDAVCLPGLTDLHTHLMGVTPEGRMAGDWMTASSATKTLRALKNLQTMLRQGFTTVRVPGDADYNFGIVALRDAIAAGHFSAPRMQVAAHMLSPTGGHSDIHAAQDHFHFKGMTVEAGTDPVREAVRRELKHGVDWIKIAASGGIMSLRDDPRVQGFTDAEIRAFADETHRYDKKITAHIHGNDAALTAAKAGYDSIEHGTLIQPETIEAMKANDVVLVPTLYVLNWIVEHGPERGVPEASLAKARSMIEQRDKSIRAAYEAGVTIGYGSDHIFDHAQSTGEFGAMVELGIANRDAIAAATTVAADLLDLENDIGRLAEGYRADIIAVPGNPLEDIDVMKQVSFVMMDGEIVAKP